MKTMTMAKQTLEDIESNIAKMISEVYEEAGMKEELEKITPYHWKTGDWQPWGGYTRLNDLNDHLHIFGEHCHWRCGGFDGFVDDMGCFRYLPGNC